MTAGMAKPLFIACKYFILKKFLVIAFPEIYFKFGIIKCTREPTITSVMKKKRVNALILKLFHRTIIT